jgi:Na+/H+ antiporter NhaD/arsenite permease-like protein
VSAVLIIFGITYLLIASEKIDKAVAALLGTGLVMFFHLVPYEELVSKIDFNVIALLVGMMMIVNILATTGVFEWIAVVIAGKAKGNGLIIMVLFMLVTAVLSAFLDNVTTVILIAPITILIAQILEIQAVPILIMEAIFSNIGGTATLVGDPPNIIIGSQASITFNEFLINLAPCILVIIAITLGVVCLMMRKNVKTSQMAVRRISQTKPAKAIVDPRRLKRALPVFFLVLLGFFMSRFMGVEPGIIALCGALIMVVVCGINIHHVLEKVEWGTIFFFVGLFMLVGALEAKGVFEILGHYIVSVTKGNLLLTALVLLWFSAIFSAVVDNIPLVIAMIPLIKSIVPVFASQMGLEGMEHAIHQQIEYPLFWSLALGACLGGNGSLIGASANVVIAQIARRNKYKLSFLDFAKYGVPLMVLSSTLSSIYIYLRYFY